MNNSYIRAGILAAAVMASSLPALAQRGVKPPTSVTPVAETVLAEGSLLASDQVFNQFMTGSTLTGNATFTLSVPNAPFPGTSLTLRSASGEVVPFALPQSGTVAAFVYSGLTASTSYTFKLDTMADSTWRISTAAPYSAVSVTAVPEVSAPAMAMMGAGLAAWTVRRRRKAA